MKRIRISLALTIFTILFIHASPSLAQTVKVNINGSVTFNGDPLIAMVLANGQYMFTGGDSLGFYDLEVPLDGNGQITLYCFVSGFAPYKEILTPILNSITRNIQMVRPNRSRLPLVDLIDIYIPADPDRRQISGNISFNGQPVCSIVLANGQSAFTCDGSGEFELDLPLDANGNITFYCFISGFSPFKIVFDPDTLVTPIMLDPVLIPMNQRLLGEWEFQYTIISTFEDQYFLDTIEENPSSSSETLPLGVWGIDEYGDPVLASYHPVADLYGLLDPGTIIDKFYIFDFLSDDIVNGCYFQIDIDTGNMGQCYAMEGLKFADLGSTSSFASKELLSAPQIDAEKERMNESKSVQPKDSILGTDFSSRFDDLTSLVYREMLDQVLGVQ